MSFILWRNFNILLLNALAAMWSHNIDLLMLTHTEQGTLLISIPTPSNEPHTFLQKKYFVGLMQERHNTIAYTLELRLSCILFIHLSCSIQYNNRLLVAAYISNPCLASELITWNVPVNAYHIPIMTGISEFSVAHTWFVGVIYSVVPI